MAAIVPVTLTMEVPTMKISIQSSAIRAAAICAAKKDIRYYLVGVHVKVAHRDYATVAGTNGHVLFAGRATIENL